MAGSAPCTPADLQATYSISKSFVSRREVADSAKRTARQSNNDMDDLNMEFQTPTEMCTITIAVSRGPETAISVTVCQKNKKQLPSSI
jgi:hypothetical protein